MADLPAGAVSVQDQTAKEVYYNSAIARLAAAEDEADMARHEVDRLSALEAFKRITASFDGVVTARQTDIGALINAGSGVGGGDGPELFRVADVHRMRIFVQVPQQFSAAVREGQIARMRLPQFPDRVFRATVMTTSRAIHTDARTLLVELEAANPDGALQPGAYARIEFDLAGSRGIVRIPSSALLFRENGLEVAVLGPADRIELRAVTVRRDLGTEVEVVTGLTLSDRVVDSPPHSIVAGQSVRVVGGAPLLSVPQSPPAASGQPLVD